MNTKKIFNHHTVAIIAIKNDKNKFRLLIFLVAQYTSKRMDAWENCEDWVIALIVLGIIAACIIITALLAYAVNNSTWKSRQQEKLDKTRVITAEQQNPTSPHMNIIQTEDFSCFTQNQHTNANGVNQTRPNLNSLYPQELLSAAPREFSSNEDKTKF